MIWTLLDWISGTAFGMILVFSFMDTEKNRRNILAFLQLFIVSSLVQTLFAVLWGFQVINMAYPLIVHLPVVLVSVLVLNKSWASAVSALLAAYILMVPRNLLGDAAVTFFPAVPYIKDVAKLAVTLPFLLLLLRFFSPYICKNYRRPTRELRFFLFPAFLYYCVAYASTVYTQALYRYSVLSIGMIALVFGLFLFSFTELYYRQLSKTMALEQQQRLIQLQAAETANLLEEIRYSQQKTKIMRHDLRHYFQVIDSLLAENDTEKARVFMRSIQTGIDETVVVQFCANESVNLILSSYAGKVKKRNIAISIKANIPAEQTDGELETCIVLANGLENALKAAAQAEAPWISVECNLFHGKIVIQIKNTCCGMPRFENGLPKSSVVGHGTGAVSIAAIAEKRGGTADFSCVDGVFTVRAVL